MVWEKWRFDFVWVIEFPNFHKTVQIEIKKIKTEKEIDRIRGIIKYFINDI